jgi:hypothetical protein
VNEITSELEDLRKYLIIRSEAVVAVMPEQIKILLTALRKIENTLLQDAAKKSFLEINTYDRFGRVM